MNKHHRKIIQSTPETINILNLVLIDLNCLGSSKFFTKNKLCNVNPPAKLIKNLKVEIDVQLKTRAKGINESMPTAYSNFRVLSNPNCKGMVSYPKRASPLIDSIPFINSLPNIKLITQLP